MYPPPIFLETDEAALSALVKAAPLAMICIVADGRPAVVHAPVRLDGRRLRFHLSRANPIASALVDGATVLAVVTGPQAYISPDWYGVDNQVPTWNYLSAQMEGPARILESDEAALLLEDLSDHFETELAPKPVWRRSKMAEGRFESLLKMIVSYEVTVERFEGVKKLGQNKRPEVRAAVASALEDLGERDISGLMRGL